MVRLFVALVVVLCSSIAGPVIIVFSSIIVGSSSLLSRAGVVGGFGISWPLTIRGYFSIKSVNIKNNGNNWLNKLTPLLIFGVMYLSMIYTIILCAVGKNDNVDENLELALNAFTPTLKTSDATVVPIFKAPLSKGLLTKSDALRPNA
ncbi:putative ORFan [Tupanvirus deep ocean]|uniref:ORFan n=2 Tax=Tupanvirus TaxID=2094720 RepID=A0AC62A903_9VIRU|nr:putative ORFan [Tupanvirus deep ocean]QKU34261.1 putative ORFan [Tupanvirus deep ocean]